MPNQIHKEKKQFNVALPADLVALVDGYATANGWTRAQAVARLLGEELGADREEIARIMQLNDKEEKR